METGNCIFPVRLEGQFSPQTLHRSHNHPSHTDANPQCVFPHLHPPHSVHTQTLIVCSLTCTHPTPHTHKPSLCVPSPAPTPFSTHTNPHHVFPHLHLPHSACTQTLIICSSPAPTPHTNPQRAYLFLHKILISGSPCNFCSHTDPPPPPPQPMWSSSAPSPVPSTNSS